MPNCIASKKNGERCGFSAKYRGNKLCGIHHKAQEYVEFKESSSSSNKKMTEAQEVEWAKKVLEEAEKKKVVRALAEEEEKKALVAGIQAKKEERHKLFEKSKELSNKLLNAETHKEGMPYLKQLRSIHKQLLKLSM
jgi:hypothetical protein